MSRTLDEIIDDLSYGSLSNLAIGSSGKGSIPDADQARIVHHINRGLTKLHSRFVLYQRELYIRIQEDVHLYPLLRQAGESYHDHTTSNPPMRYIIDSAEAPFSEDVIRILGCWRPSKIDPTDLVEVPLNDENAEESVWTPATSTLQILDGKAGDIYHVMYQADHYRLRTGVGPQKVYLPEILYEALEHYVAYKIFGSMNGEEHTIKAQEHRNTYESVLLRAIDLDLVKAVSVSTNVKLELRGFK